MCAMCMDQYRFEISCKEFEGKFLHNTVCSRNNIIIYSTVCSLIYIVKVSDGTFFMHESTIVVYAFATFIA